MVDANLVYYFCRGNFTPLYQYYVIQFPLGDVYSYIFKLNYLVLCTVCPILTNMAY